MSSQLMFFTYATHIDSAALLQGDVLCRTPGLDAILQAVHPHYLKPDYRFFLVLTQSCDLVRRDGGPCKAPYITIAAVRPLSRALERYGQRLLRDPIEAKLSFGSDERKARLRQFVEKVLNNNEPEFFFLHSEPSAGLAEDHCAFLQLSIALKAGLHYQTLLSAKVLQLTDSFQHKLGYLVGTSYSRVATDDWVPKYASQESFEEVVRSHVESVRITWFDRKLCERALKRLRALPDADCTLEALETAVRELRRTREQKRNEVLELVARVALEADFDAASIERLTQRLRNDPSFLTQITSGAA